MDSARDCGLQLGDLAGGLFDLRVKHICIADLVGQGAHLRLGFFQFHT
jgi:hypothetical protein